MPLSLELAAARTRLLPPSALLGKLENALDALGSGPVDLPERQRALRTTLDWDHALLSDCEQIVLRRLSVFPRHFTLEAAEHVVGDPGLDVFDALDGLVGKSLVRPFEAELPGEPRFVQLQTVREYAHERLDAAGESDSTHRRHAAHVLARVELADGSATSELEAWLSVLEREHDDIRVALDWADQARDVDTLVRMAAGLGTFWRSHCHFSEGRRWLDRALALTSGQRSPVRAELLRASGHLSRARGDLATAEAQYREALAIREELGEDARVAAVVAADGQRRVRARRPRRRRGLVAARPRACSDGPDDDAELMGLLNNLGVRRTPARRRRRGHPAVRRVVRDRRAARLARHAGAGADEQGECAGRAGRLRPGSHHGCGRRWSTTPYLDDTWDLVDALDVLAGAVGRGAADAALSGWLFGAAAGLRAALDVRRMPVEEGDYELGFGQSRVTRRRRLRRGVRRGRRGLGRPDRGPRHRCGRCRMILTPDQRLRVFVSSTLGELAAERAVVRDAIESLRLAPVMFEMGARPHPPRALYRAYLEQSHVFLAIYANRYGWVAPTMDISGLEDEYRLCGRPSQARLRPGPRARA